MAEAGTCISNDQYRYQIIAQDFSLESGVCLLIVRDNLYNKLASFPVEILFKDEMLLQNMNPRDIKLLGYIYACEQQKCSLIKQRLNL